MGKKKISIKKKAAVLATLGIIGLGAFKKNYNYKSEPKVQQFLTDALSLDAADSPKLAIKNLDADIFSDVNMLLLNKNFTSKATTKPKLSTLLRFSAEILAFDSSDEGLVLINNLLLEALGNDSVGLEEDPLELLNSLELMVMLEATYADKLSSEVLNLLHTKISISVAALKNIDARGFSINELTSSLDLAYFLLDQDLDKQYLVEFTNNILDSINEDELAESLPNLSKVLSVIAALKQDRNLSEKVNTQHKLDSILIVAKSADYNKNSNQEKISCLISFLNLAKNQEVADNAQLGMDNLIASMQPPLSEEEAAAIDSLDLTKNTLPETTQDKLSELINFKSNNFK